MPSQLPPQLLQNLPFILTAISSFILGFLVMLMIARSKKATLEERIRGEKRRANDVELRLASMKEAADHSGNEAQHYRIKLSEIHSKLEAERKAAAEKASLLERSEEKLTNVFKALSSDALQGASQQFLYLAKSSLKFHTQEAKGDLEKRHIAINNMMKPVTDSLNKFETRVREIEQKREGAYTAIKEQVHSLSKGQLGLQKETASLVKALRQPTGRGQWGEMQLRRVIELAGMQEHCDFTLQPHTTTDEGKRLRPDLIVKLPGKKTVVVDSKTPMDAYLNALEADSEQERELFLHNHAKQVRAHIKQLSSKDYARQFRESPEFTVLFLPSESFFSAALNSDPGLIENGVSKGVILATPTTLIALLKAVAYGWKQEAITINAKEISELGRTIHERLATLAKHFSKLGNSLNSSVNHYNKAISSFDTRILTTARKFEDLKATNERTTFPELQEIDRTTRPIKAPAQPKEATPEIHPEEKFVGFT